MDGLPPGTVTLLFSDMEGSTRLLSRLGSRYAEVLDGQREVLRGAWGNHGGIEMGTEGDSFYVVFSAAEHAVAAAAEAQRQLAVAHWPNDEHVRVRIGMHTGTPSVHNGAYIGMDVHRAARIASAAHGGQVVVSSATAELVSQLKDLPADERLFQLVISDAPNDHPPLKGLGSTANLPVPTNQLVGRDGLLRELATLTREPHVRLLTLTGPGGSGKTRLAISLAGALADDFPDGVYFVALAAVTDAAVMWTSIGEVLDIEPDQRGARGVGDRVRHQRLLLVLDNLEQLPGADAVVEQLLAESTLKAIVTSRRPLHIYGEHEHPVPTLALPAGDDVDAVSSSPAVQLFAAQATRRRSGFAITEQNAADVAELCRRLDGLPLAMELAASRMNLLSPHVLLARLDRFLELATTEGTRPGRHHTLRETIAWSYELLTPEQQRNFRRFGVFAGGADLEAVGVILDADSDDDTYDRVADLVDASLVFGSEDESGEPRVSQLETVRAFARQQLRDAGELDALSECHARYYLEAARVARDALPRAPLGEGRLWFEREHDNLRDALGWTLGSDDDRLLDPHRVDLGRQLCLAIAKFWNSENWVEGRAWLERAIDRGSSSDSVTLADCLRALATATYDTGDPTLALDRARAGVEMCRRLPASEAVLIRSLVALGLIEEDRELSIARTVYDEALALARALGDQSVLMAVLGTMATFEGIAGHEELSLARDLEAAALAEELGDLSSCLNFRHNSACSLRILGRLDEALAVMNEQIPQEIKSRRATDLVILAEDFGALAAELGHPEHAGRLLAAADSARERMGFLRPGWQDTEIRGPMAQARAAMTADDWDAAYQSGWGQSVEDVLVEAHMAVNSG